MVFIKLFSFLLLSLVFSLSACSRLNSSTSGQVQVILSNNTVLARSYNLMNWGSFTLSSGTASTPNEFKVRLKSIYLVEDQANADQSTNWLGNNVGNAIQIWRAPDCVSGNDADCAGMNYFNLAEGSSVVNGALASQKISVTAGTYRYIKLGLLGEQQGPNNTYDNTQWAYSDGVSITIPTQEFASIQTEWATPFLTPLVIAEGDTFNVNLSYNLSDTAYVGSTSLEKTSGGGTSQPDRADDCSGTAGGRVCFIFPALAVTAEKI